MSQAVAKGVEGPPKSKRESIYSQAGGSVKGLVAVDSGRLRYMAVHFSADPDKTPEWAAKMMDGVPVDEWNREMELYENIYDGEPIFKDYKDDWHCPKPIRNAHLPIVSGSNYLVGIDCGLTLQPAAVLLQITPPPIQVHALLELIAPGESMERFAPLLLQTLMRWHPGLWSQVQYYGDETVTTRSGTNGQSAQDVAKKHGIHIKPVSNQWAGRFSAATWLLTDRIDEQRPRFFVSGVGCPVLRKGFQGAYQWRKATTADQRGPGMVLQQPLKNAFSHVMDGFMQAAQVVRKEYGGKKSAQVGNRYR